MASRDEKMMAHFQRERVLALSRLFDSNPEHPEILSQEAQELPLPEGLKSRDGAVRELVAFLDSASADVRRLAASALGKMAPEKPAAPFFVPYLAQLVMYDEKPQVRQYAAKALSRYPAEAWVALEDLKDVARDMTQPDYVRKAVSDAIAKIQAEATKQHSVVSHFCRRCHRRISQEEYRISRERFGNGYCRHCLDEKELEGWNFESTVEAAKDKRTMGGTAVQSIGEKRIAEFLEREKIEYRYDERYRIAEGDVIRPDFYLPEFDLYIEYYGMDTPEYNENRKRKHILYQRAAKKLISVSFRDDANLVTILKAKLAQYIRFKGAENAGKIGCSVGKGMTGEGTTREGTEGEGTTI